MSLGERRRVLARTRRNEELQIGDYTLQTARHATAEVVVINGLDHLESRFPLCSRERMFVPAIISLFRKYKVCLVIASSESSQGSAAAEADLVLRFQPIIESSRKQPRDVHQPQCTGPGQQTRVTAAQVPAGQIGGRGGILYRCEGETMQFRPDGDNEPS